MYIWCEYCIKTYIYEKKQLSFKRVWNGCFLITTLLYVCCKTCKDKDIFVSLGLALWELLLPSTCGQAESWGCSLFYYFVNSVDPEHCVYYSSTVPPTQTVYTLYRNTWGICNVYLNWIREQRKSNWQAEHCPTTTRED